ncbi:MAG: ABC transporter permease subunit [Rhodobacteraceae bacterium]|nr:ABC transporter permease subunit [Paracoccaceae bacterium]NKB29779.1 ABC transporter permease subunit [Paracoccaceae bacterium]
MTDTTAQSPAPQDDQKSKEAYFTASQRQLIWARFKKQRAAMIAAMVLIVLILSGLFAPFLSPYDPTIAGRDKDYTNGAPQMPQFCDSNGCSLRPFIHAVTRERSMATNFRWVTKVDEDTRLPMQFFVRGDRYKLFGFVPGNIHLFGVEGGKIHLFGTDEDGQDIFSRTLHAVWTSMQVGTIGVVIAFVLALIIGGVAGYYGGWIDSIIQMVTDAVRVVPVIPLFMAISAIIAAEGSRIGIGDWTLVELGPGLSSEGRFFIISIILGLVGWPTLARRVRTHMLTERNQEYVLAAQLCGAKPGHVIRRHLLPSFTSYIIVDLVISFPYMVLSETALSFIGLGLKDPVSSLGVMLQKATSADVLLNYQWYFIPVIFFVALVMAFVFVGDGLRDAADPYSDSH